MPIRPHKKIGRKPDTPAKEWSIDDFQVPPQDGKVRFHDFDLPPEIMHAVADLGFNYCMPIQAEVLEPGIEGCNLAGQAQTGTGKTAAFLISMFTRFLAAPRQGRSRPGAPRALVIAPTRELVMQIEKDAQAIARHCGIRSLAVYGGTDFTRQERELKQGPIDLIAATPGRLLDFVSRRLIHLGDTGTLVIDEADRMLDMGFIPDVRRIIGRLPPKDRRCTMLFSATLSPEVRRLASQWMPDPVYVEVEPEQVTVDTVTQIVYALASREKFQVLYNLLKNRPETKRVLVFGNRRDSTQRLARKLDAYGISCRLLSGLVEQKRRFRILEDFRHGKFPVLVATDVAGRGLHVDGITHVVNFDFPYEAQDYVHRIGRTGRAGAVGTAVSFACEQESFIIPEIEAFIGCELDCRQPEKDLFQPLPKVTERPEPPPPQRRGGPSGNRRRSRPQRRRRATP